MLESATTHHHVESIVAQSLTTPKSRGVHEAYEAFGVLWRLTGQIPYPLAPRSYVIHHPFA